MLAVITTQPPQGPCPQPLLLPEKVASIAKGVAPNVPKSSVALLHTLPRSIGLPSGFRLDRPPDLSSPRLGQDDTHYTHEDKDTAARFLSSRPKVRETQNKGVGVGGALFGGRVCPCNSLQRFL